MTSLTEIKSALLDAGWVVGHISRDESGKERSIYLRQAGDLTGDTEIRLSDHDLGSTVYGEPQGGRWAVNLVIDPRVSVTDHLAAVTDDDYRNSCFGFACGYSLAEFDADGRDRA